jgi:hypothetical protein
MGLQSKSAVIREKNFRPYDQAILTKPPENTPGVFS